MDKTAQKRRWRDQILEKVDIFGRGTEALSPTFSKLMDQLRSTDDKIREILLEDDPRIKDILKSARSNFNRREYMTTVSSLVVFHGKLESVINELKGLTALVDEAHSEFVYKGLPSDTLKDLRKLREKFETKANLKTNFVKEAGLADWWHVLTQERGRALRGWEKRYPSKMRQLKNETASLLNKSDQLFNILLSTLKDMSAARGSRNIDKYLKATEKLMSRFDDYHNEFKEYYKNNVKNFLEKLYAEEEKKKVEEQEKGKKEEQKKVKTEDTGLGEQEVVKAPSVKSPPPSSVPYSAPPSSYRQPTPASEIEPGAGPATERQSKPPSHHTSAPPAVRPVTPTQPSEKNRLELPLQSDIPDPTVSELYRQIEHGKLPPNPVPSELRETMRSKSNLVSTLELFANERPEVMALEISKYATSIKYSDPKTSKKLFDIVEKILNGK